MGKALSRFYFDQATGQVRLQSMTLVTAGFGLAYGLSFLKQIRRVNDDSMQPYLQKGYLGLGDLVLIRKVIYKGESIENRIVAVIDPFTHGRIVFRRVVADEGRWVQRSDDGGLIQIPKGHVWLECENEEGRNTDSLSELDGPVSKRFILGPCQLILWPIWRFTTFTDLDKYKKVLGHDKSKYSRVYTDKEMYVKYGIEK